MSRFLQASTSAVEADEVPQSSGSAITCSKKTHLFSLLTFYYQHLTYIFNQCCSSRNKHARCEMCKRSAWDSGQLILISFLNKYKTRNIYWNKNIIPI
jgi:hypothetical protein